MAESLHRSAAALAGELMVRPGVPCPQNLVSSRPNWVHRLAPGTAADQLPHLLATVFGNCAEAHRLCATLAVNAAQGHDGPVAVEALQRLQLETLREHIRRLVLDWPQRLAPGPQGLQLQRLALLHMRAAPVLPGMPVAQWAAHWHALLPWMEHSLLGARAASWLNAWSADPLGCLQEWCAKQHGWLAQLLNGCQDAAQCVCPPVQALHVHGDDVTLRNWALQLETGEVQAHHPHWQGWPAETGPWTRLAEAQPEVYGTPWLKLGARLAEALRLAQPGVSHLQAGCLSLGLGRGVAWVEMARGVLLHAVTLARDVVLRCEVVAPTEWNFHPHGAVAQVLAQSAGVTKSQIDGLMLAYDPCVSYQILETASKVEANHA